MSWQGGLLVWFCASASFFATKINNISSTEQSDCQDIWCRHQILYKLIFHWEGGRARHHQAPRLIHICSTVLAPNHMSPFAALANLTTCLSTCMNPSAVAPATYPPSSTAPTGVLLQLLATFPRPTSVPPSSADSRLAHVGIVGTCDHKLVMIPYYVCMWLGTSPHHMCALPLSPLSSHILQWLRGKLITVLPYLQHADCT